MAQQGLLIDYEFCTGCHTCEMACKVVSPEYISRRCSNR